MWGFYRKQQWVLDSNACISLIHSLASLSLIAALFNDPVEWIHTTINKYYALVSHKMLFVFQGTIYIPIANEYN